MMKKKLVMFLLIVILLLLISYYYPLIEKQITGNTINNQNQDNESVYVVRAVDGDTIYVRFYGNDSEFVIRLLGINTPEKNRPYYNEAKSFLKNLENGYIKLEKDKEDFDRYGRRLRYVYHENRLINKEILENGLATSFMLDNLKYKDELIMAENHAINNQLGIWKRSSDYCSSCIVLLELNSLKDYFIIENKCDYSCNLIGWSVKDDANHFINLKNIDKGMEQKYDSNIIFNKEIWNDDHDRFFLRDDKGELVIFYSY